MTKAKAGADLPVEIPDVLPILPLRNSARLGGGPNGRDVCGIFGNALAAKYRGTRHQRIGPRGGHGSGIVARDTAVNFEPDRPVADHGFDPLDLWELGFKEGLAAKSRIDRHHQYEVETIEYIFDRALGR